MFNNLAWIIVFLFCITENVIGQDSMISKNNHISFETDSTGPAVFSNRRSSIFEFAMGLGSGGNMGTSFSSNIAVLFPLVKGSRHLLGFTFGVEDLASEYGGINVPLGMRYQVLLGHGRFAKPFIYADAGWSFMNLEHEFITFRDNNIEGFRKEIGIGVAFSSKHKEIAWFLKSAYLTQDRDYMIDQNWGWSSSKIDEQLRRILFSVGIYF